MQPRGPRGPKCQEARVSTKYLCTCAVIGHALVTNRNLCMVKWVARKEVCVFCNFTYLYRSGTVNSKSFVGKVLLRIKWKFKLN